MTGDPTMQRPPQQQQQTPSRPHRASMVSLSAGPTKGVSEGSEEEMSLESPTILGHGETSEEDHHEGSQMTTDAMSAGS